MIKKSGIVLFTALFLTACHLSPYSISVNDNIVFSPQGQLPEEDFSDPGLQACVNNYLNDNPDESMQSMSLLSCPDAGITTLAGLEQLGNLSLLDLSNNNISDLGPLRELERLRVLRVSNNQIRNIGVLDDLSLLNFIDLSGNASITCRQLDRLEDRLGNTLRRPLSCL